MSVSQDPTHDFELLDEMERARIVDAIEAKAVRGCPMCGTDDAALVDGYAHLVLYRDAVKHDSLGDALVPSAATICTHCGYVSLFALGVLGLLSATPEDSGSDG